MTTQGIAVGITTALRSAPTLPQSLRSLRAAGCAEPIYLFDDGCCLTLADEKLVRSINTPARGPFMNWCHALAELLRTDAGWLVLLEDDIIWAAGAWPVLLQELAMLEREEPSLGLYSVYASKAVTTRLEWSGLKPLPPALYHYPGRKAGGSQAYCIPRASAHWLLHTSERFADQMKMRNVPFDPARHHLNENRGRDITVSYCLAIAEKPFVVRVPGLVNHSLGSGNSSFYYKKEQDTVYFSQQASFIGELNRCLP